MEKVPVSLIIDDSAPLVSVFYHHASAKKQTRDGRPLQPIFPNSLLLDFCEVMERHGKDHHGGLTQIAGHALGAAAAQVNVGNHMVQQQ